MKKKGFTYIEVMIAFAIFALIFTYVMKLNSSSNAVMRDERQRLQMMYVAQMELETFKSQLVARKGYNVQGFYVSVTKGNKIGNLIDVKVTVTKNMNDSDDKAIILISRVFVQ